MCNCRMAGEDVDVKRGIIHGLVMASVGVFALNRFVNSSARIPLKTRLGWNDFIAEKLCFNRDNRCYTAITYSLNHHSWRHMGFNMALMFTLGSQIADSGRYSVAGLLGLTGGSAVATAIAEAPFLKPGSPLIGASGIAMGYLGSLAAVDPDKVWLMIIPIPGVPITTLQLFQACFFGHVVGLVWVGLTASTRLALRGHLAGLTAGYFLTRSTAGTHDGVPMLENSKQQWLRSITSAELILYWMYLSVRLLLPMPFSTETEIGDMRAKRRFIRRTWKEDF